MAIVTQIVKLSKSFNNLDRRIDQVWNGDSKRVFLGQLDQTGQPVQYPLRLDSTDTDIFPNSTLFLNSTSNPLTLFKAMDGHFHLVGEGQVGSGGFVGPISVTLMSLLKVIPAQNTIQSVNRVVLGVNSATDNDVVIAVKLTRSTRTFAIQVESGTTYTAGDTFSFDIILRTTTAAIAG